MAIINFTKNYITTPLGRVGGGSGNNYISSASSASSDVASRLRETHTFWGQPFNGTQDVFGDLTGVGGIQMSGDLISEGSGNFQYLNISKDASIFGGLFVDGSTKLNDGLLVNGDTKLNGKLAVDDDASFQDIFTNNITNTAMIKTKDLTVLGSAHFYELIIDKVKSVGGQIILSDANARIDDVEAIRDLPTMDLPDDVSLLHRPTSTGSTYSVSRLWVKTEQDGKAITNDFDINDFVVCQSFNQAEVGANYDVANKFIWSQIVSTGYAEHRFPNREAEESAYYIDVIRTYEGQVYGTWEGSFEVGDEVVQLGNMVDKMRQNAITISAYNNSYLDTVGAPSIVQYSGINKFGELLTPFRVTTISPSGNMFQGTFKVISGEQSKDLLEYINEQLPDEVVVYKTWLAYSNSPDGTNYVKAEDKGATEYVYLGIANSVAEPTDKSQYFWSKIQGDATVRIVPVKTEAKIDAQKKLSVYISAYFYSVNGTNVTPLDLSGNNYTLMQSTDNEDGSNNSTRIIPKQGWTYNTETGLGVFAPPVRDLSSETFPSGYTLYIVKEPDKTVQDSISVPVQTLSGAFFEVTDKISGRVTDASNNIANLEVSVGGIQLSVDNISDGLLGTGVDIEHHTITFTSDNIIAQNNRGETTFKLNENGDVYVGGSGVFNGFVFSPPTIITAENYNDYCFYDSTGVKVMDIEKTSPYIIFKSLPSAIPGTSSSNGRAMAAPPPTVETKVFFDATISHNTAQICDEMLCYAQDWDVPTFKPLDVSVWKYVDVSVYNPTTGQTETQTTVRAIDEEEADFWETYVSPIYLPSINKDGTVYHFHYDWTTQEKVKDIRRYINTPIVIINCADEGVGLSGNLTLVSPRGERTEGVSTVVPSRSARYCKPIYTFARRNGKCYECLYWEISQVYPQSDGLVEMYLD